MKKYVFVATIKQLEQHYKYYCAAKAALDSKGYVLLDDWLSKVNPFDFTIGDMDTRKQVFYDEYMNNLKAADFVIFDISVSSRTVQYQVAMALFNNVKSICIRMRGSALVPFLLTQIHDDNLQLVEYDEATLPEALKDL